MSAFKRDLLSRFEQRLNEILLFPGNRNKRLDFFLKDMSEVFKIYSHPENVDLEVRRIYQKALDAKE